MSEGQQKFRLGLFVMVCLLLLAGLIILFGGSREFLTERNVYFVIFEDAPGMEAGVPVRKSGVRIGIVRESVLTPEGKVRVRLELNRDFMPRASDEATISRGLIATDTSIDFIPRKQKFDERGKLVAISTEIIPPGSEIIGVSPFNARQFIDEATNEAKPSIEQIRRSLKSLEELTPQMRETLREIAELARTAREFVPEVRRTNDDVREAIASVKNVGPELKKTTEEARNFLKVGTKWVDEIGQMVKNAEPTLTRTIENVDKTFVQANKLLNDENQKTIVATLENVKNASKNFDALSASASKNLDSISAGANDLIRDSRGAIKKVTETLDKTDGIVTDIRATTQPLAEKAPKIIGNIESGSDQVYRMAGDIREIVRSVGRAEGTFQKFIADPGLYNNANESAAALMKIMPRLDRAMRDFETFADKIARHPESLGVGGVVRPSSGIKDAPPSPQPGPTGVFRPRN